MRSRSPKAARAAPIRGRAIPDLDAGMLARLGALLAIAFGFGLAAQLLVGVPH